MNIWETKRWKRFYKNTVYRNGLRVICDKNIHPEVRRAVKEFVSWLRKEFKFPKRVRMYIKAQRRIKSKKGDMVCGTFFRPADRNIEPYIRVATGDYEELVVKRGKDNALAAVLFSIAHELTHYFQWLNDIDLTLIGEERQASVYERKIVDFYAETRDHP